MRFNSPVPGRPAPFVIWTLQRTGGTNLTQRLTELSALEGVHEPFNLRRVYGHVTQRWFDTQDASTLAADMAAVVERGQVIKHCVENVPWEVSAALARASVAAGYRHLFLYRRQPLGRLLSLQYAKVTGVWGPKMKGKSDEKLELTDPALPVPQLVRHEQHCADLLGRAWEMLLASGVHPFALAFEDLYAAERAQAQELLAQLLAELGVSLPAAEQAALLEQLVGQGSQGTSSKYQQFQGIAALQEALAVKVRPFIPAPLLRACRVEMAKLDASWVCWATLDALPAIVPARLKLAGVAVLAPDAPNGLSLWLEPAASAQSGEPPALCQSVPWRFASKWMAQKFPASPNGAKARFAAQVRLEADSVDLVLAHLGSEQRQRVARIHCVALGSKELAAAVAVPAPEAWAPEVWRRSLAITLAQVPVEGRDADWQAAQQGLA